MSFYIFALIVTTPIFTQLCMGQNVHESLIDGSHQGSQSYFDMYVDFNTVLQQANSFERKEILADIEAQISAIYRYGYISVLSYLLQNDGENASNNCKYCGDNALSNSTRNAELLESLFQEMNSGSSISLCINDTTRLFLGLLDTEKWIVPFIDSVGKPGVSISKLRLNWVGNYRQCRAALAPGIRLLNIKSFKGNYCTLSVFLGKPLPLNPLGAIQIGTCLPDTCDNQQLTQLFNAVLKRVPVNSSKPLTSSVECLNDVREYTTATYIAILVVCILCTAMALGTAYDIMFVQSLEREVADERDLLPKEVSVNSYLAGQEPSETRRDEPNEGTSLLRKETPSVEVTSRQGVCSKILLSFSVYTNGSKVLNTSQPAGSLTAIHGIRFLSMTWVILCHTYIYGARYTDNVIEEILQLTDRWTFDVIVNGFVSVDTFFTLSGLLTAYTALREMKRRGTWKLNWPLFYFHRFWRLTPPYMLTLLIVLGLIRFLGSGPLWGQVQPSDQASCEKYWWTNLLYVNNLVHMVTLQSSCLGHTWYLANDMQFFILSPLMIIPLFLNVYAGVGSCMGFLLVSWITTGVLSTQRNWPANPISVNPVLGAHLKDWFAHYYVVPWCRIGPFIIGILTGYFLAVNNGRVQMKKFVSAVGWACAAAVCLAVLYGLDGDIRGSSVSSTGVAAVYNAVSRSAWAAGVCWVIVACTSGNGGFVNQILSWSPFVVLSRLTYMAYLLHPAVISVYFGNHDELFHFNDTNIVVTFLGLVTGSYVIAFAFMLALESPMVGLERSFLRVRVN